MSQTVEDDVLHLFMKTGQPGAIEEHCRSGLLFISRGTSIILLLVYVAYLVFQLKTHASLFQPPEGQEEEEELEMSPPVAGVALLAVTVVTSFAADYREWICSCAARSLPLIHMFSCRFYRGDCRKIQCSQTFHRFDLAAPRRQRR